MITLDTLYKELKRDLYRADIETADLDARYILEHRAEITAADLIIALAKEIPDDVEAQIRSDLAARLAGKPISKIHGKREFWGRDFIVTQDTLDPRPDTETLIEAALDKYKDTPPAKIIDLGTGTGCILITLLKEWPQTEGIGTDISSAALEIAKQNASKHSVEERCTLIESSWFDNVADSDFDLILSNPPYIKSAVIPELSVEVQKYDPILALDGGENGLEEYKKILSQIKNKTKRPANILFEIGYDQQDDLTRLAEESRFVVNAVHRDLLGNPRVVDISSGDK